jgi:hypothetical protein
MFVHGEHSVEMMKTSEHHSCKETFQNQVEARILFECLILVAECHWEP